MATFSSPTQRRLSYTQTHAFTGSWTMGRPSDHTVDWSMGLRAGASFESVPSHVAQTYGYGQQLFPGYHWPTTDPYTQSYGSGIVSQESSFPGMVTSETSTVVPTPSSGTLNHWGDNESGPFASTFYANLQTPYQPRTGLVPSWRFQPCGAPSADSNEHRSTDVGLSTLAAPPTTYLAPPTANPSGGLSEETADAENVQTIAEEDAAPTAPVTVKPRDGRIRYTRDVRRLCHWAQGWENLPRVPSHKKALGIALEVIKAFRVPVYDGPRLLKGIGKRTAEGKKGADFEHKRRSGTRGLNQELSRYYQLPGNWAAWACPELVLMVLEDVLDLP